MHYTSCHVDGDTNVSKNCLALMALHSRLTVTILAKPFSIYGPLLRSLANAPTHDEPSCVATADSESLLVDAAIFTVGFVLLMAVLILSRALATDMGEMLTRNAVRLSLSWYALTLGLMMGLGAEIGTQVHLPDASPATAGLWRCCAFWFTWRWPSTTTMTGHTRTPWRTRQISGIGEGIYVSYLFTILWALDVLCWWLRPAQYAARLCLDWPLIARIYALHRVQQHGRLRDRYHPLGRYTHVYRSSRRLADDKAPPSRSSRRSSLGMIRNCILARTLCLPFSWR